MYIYIYVYSRTYVYITHTYIYTHTHVHLTLQRAKLTLQRAFFSKWRIEGSNRRGQGSGQAALCSQSSRSDWSRVVMEFHIWNLISLVPMIAWIGFAVGTWQAYDAPVQVAGNCFISTAGKDWAAGCFVGCGVSSQSAVSWKKLIGMHFILIFAKWSMSKLWTQYMQNGIRFAKFLLDRAQSKKTALQFSLLDGILAFWRATKGPGNRRA